jgi:hypothetical protein
MGYVIAAILVVLIVGGFVLLLVTNATRKSNVSDESPAGDTSEHAGEENARRFDRAKDQPNVAPPVVGGEGEGERSTR